MLQSMAAQGWTPALGRHDITGVCDAEPFYAIFTDHHD